MEYVCGFCFDSTLTHVLLIRKLKGPVNMAGKLNGIGGKIEPGETPLAAMNREFLEEVRGFDDSPPMWSLIHRMTHLDVVGGATVHFFAACGPYQSFIAAQSREKEQISRYPWREVCEPASRHKPIYNLAYLLPMAYVFLSYPAYRWIEEHRPPRGCNPAHCRLAATR